MRLDINSQDFRDAKNHIYGLVHNVCLNDKEQEILIKTLQEEEQRMIDNREPGDVIIKHLLYPIMDGLSYGNWPWIVNTLKIK